MRRFVAQVDFIVPPETEELEHLLTGMGYLTSLLLFIYETLTLLYHSMYQQERCTSTPSLVVVRD